MRWVGKACGKQSTKRFSTIYAHTHYSILIVDGLKLPLITIKLNYIICGNFNMYIIYYVYSYSAWIIYILNTQTI